MQMERTPNILWCGQALFINYRRQGWRSEFRGGGELANERQLVAVLGRSGGICKIIIICLKPQGPLPPRFLPDRQRSTHGSVEHAQWRTKDNRENESAFL